MSLWFKGKKLRGRSWRPSFYFSADPRSLTPNLRIWQREGDVALALYFAHNGVGLKYNSRVKTSVQSEKLTGRKMVATPTILVLKIHDVRKVESNNYAARRLKVWSLDPPPGRIMHTKRIREFTERKAWGRSNPRCVSRHNFATTATGDRLVGSCLTGRRRSSGTPTGARSQADTLCHCVRGISPRNLSRRRALGHHHGGGNGAFLEAILHHTRSGNSELWKETREKLRKEAKRKGFAYVPGTPVLGPRYAPWNLLVPWIMFGQYGKQLIVKQYGVRTGPTTSNVTHYLLYGMVWYGRSYFKNGWSGVRVVASPRFWLEGNKIIFPLISDWSPITHRYVPVKNQFWQRKREITCFNSFCPISIARQNNRAVEGSWSTVDALGSNYNWRRECHCQDILIPKRTVFGTFFRAGSAGNVM